MDIIRREADYAFRCLVRLSELDEGAVESVRQIATAESLPEPMLRKIFQRLGRSGIVASTKGSRGGVRLARAVYVPADAARTWGTVVCINV